MQAYSRRHRVAANAVFAGWQMRTTAGCRVHHAACEVTNTLHSSVLLCSDLIAGSGGIVTRHS
jgi:uncharacterized protein (UPF0548 family)